MKLAEYKTKNRYTYKDLAGLFDTNPRTVMYWVHIGMDYKRENGNHVISRNQIIKTIPIKKG